MPDTCLKIRTQSRGPVSVLALSGELDVTTVGGLTDKAAAALATRPARLIVDLSALEFSDCGGARTLAALARSPEGDCTVILRAARPLVRRVLGLIGMPVEHPRPSREQHYLRAPDALADSPAGWLLRQSRQAREESRVTCETVAATREKMAAVLARSAELRPHAADRLAILSQEARQRAAAVRAACGVEQAPVAR